ncbi:MAG: hypothetical protein AVDCRST_MAG76-730, partial [uncultured Acidimicrobiales bacterium]
ARRAGPSGPRPPRGRPRSPCRATGPGRAAARRRARDLRRYAARRGTRGTRGSPP